MRRLDQAAWVGILVLATSTASGDGASGSAAGSGPVNAIWVEHDLSFTYMGFTSYYSCIGIEGKVESVLKELGARPGFKVTSSGCIRSSGPEIMPRVRVRAALPMEATPELLAQLERDRARRELAGRAGGQPVASADAATAQFPATWRTVKFRDTATSNVENGDCEMLEQLVEQVLLKMGVREAADSSLDCGAPRQVPLNAVRLNLEVLAPPPAEQAGVKP